RHRPRRRRLFVRLLHGDEEYRDRARQSQDPQDRYLMLRDPVFNPPCYIVRDEDADALYLRGLEERNHHSVVLRKSEDIAALAIGFKVGAEDDLDKAAAWLSARGLPVSWPKLPFQGRTLRTLDVVGMPLDLYFSMDRVPSMLQKYAAYK